MRAITFVSAVFWLKWLFRYVKQEYQSPIQEQLVGDIRPLPLTPMTEIRPIESIMKLQHSPGSLDYESHYGECFTFFSDLQPKWKILDVKNPQIGNFRNFQSIGNSYQLIEKSNSFFIHQAECSNCWEMKIILLYHQFLGEMMNFSNYFVQTDDSSHYLCKDCKIYIEI